ncbi:nicotinamide-nucleotide amidohydrolase PncC [Pedobacter glucosidilyticus]|nr:CinA family protein [Pedobacter glucosidilyticus]KHJ39654.1 nicotinamide-nucleotide amidohydrolase PncC [Pedobacter glucosidilyticus]
MEELAKQCCQLLKDKKLTISFAESVTSGALCAAFATVEGSGAVFKGGLVCYNGDVKKQYLGVSDSLIEHYTPESAEVTRQMAIGLKDFMGTDVVVAITGLCSPGGSEAPDKPVGTIFTHLLHQDKSLAYRDVFPGDSSTIISLAVAQTYQYIIQLLKSY